MPFVVTIVLAFLGGAVVTLIAGENPVRIYSLLFEGSFGSWTNLGYTLYYATPFIFTGLAVAIPYRVLLFNIGAEGQFYISGIFLYAAYTWVAHLPAGLALILCLFSAAVGGALWSGLAGIFKAYRGCHEVITTIMLNFIGAGLVSYFVLYVWKDPQSQIGETLTLSSKVWLPKLGMGESPLNVSFILAVAAAVCCWFFLEKTKWGFEMRASGLNPSATETSGLSVKKSILLSMLIGGVLASGVAMNEILGNVHRVRDGFCAGYGFIGIAVAFLGRTNPLGVILSALFFGALYKGAGEIEMDSDRITRDFSVVMQAIFIASVACEGFLRVKWEEWKVKRRLRLASAAKANSLPVVPDLLEQLPASATESGTREVLAESKEVVAETRARARQDRVTSEKERETEASL